MVTCTWFLREESLLEAVGRKLLETEWSTVCAKVDKVSRFILVFKSHGVFLVSCPLFPALNTSEHAEKLSLLGSYLWGWMCNNSWAPFRLGAPSQCDKDVSWSLSHGYGRAYSRDYSSTPVPQLWVTELQGLASVKSLFVPNRRAAANAIRPR